MLVKRPVSNQDSRSLHRITLTDRDQILAWYAAGSVRMPVILSETHDKKLPKRDFFQKWTGIFTNIHFHQQGFSYGPSRLIIKYFPDPIMIRSIKEVYVNAKS